MNSLKSVGKQLLLFDTPVKINYSKLGKQLEADLLKRLSCKK